MAVTQLSDGNPEGTVLGQTSTDLIGFWGLSAGVARYATSTGAPASTAAVSVSATQWGYSTSTQANALAVLGYHLAIALSQYGLTTSA